MPNSLALVILYLVTNLRLLSYTPELASVVQAPTRIPQKPFMPLRLANPTFSKPSFTIDKINALLLLAQTLRNQLDGPEDTVWMALAISRSDTWYYKERYREVLKCRRPCMCYYLILLSKHISSL